ncbi:MAG: inositol monophosphatase [SAR86 cluster bacterium]|uniref:Inositol-1-monophosphatase n=1 Tax=SAR86 cluster bacterium TaxID=2030880 RepID=A0A2A5AZ24_9GAMM|nr:MAG: inositol monophosphatase [SAR86 cluster bacterium]
MTDILQFTTALAQEAGELIVTERAEAELTHNYKSGDELVTSADLKADQLICDRIATNFPDHFILSEESSPDIGNIQELNAPVWIIDPIDGTVNYAHGHNQSAISIAYVEGSNIQVGVVFNPFSNEMFCAKLGAGATLNGNLIEVSKEAAMKRALIATGFPYDKSTIGPMIPRLHAVLLNCADIRRLGSAALDICFLAMGRLDGYYESLSIWDFAAAQLIAKEAGAEFGHFSAVPEGIDPQFYDRDILIANPSIYPQLLALLQAADKQ